MRPVSQIPNTHAATPVARPTSASIAAETAAPQPLTLAKQLTETYKPALHALAVHWLAASMPRTHVELLRPNRELTDSEFAARNREMAGQIIDLLSTDGTLDRAAKSLAENLPMPFLQALNLPSLVDQNNAALKAFAVISQSLNKMGREPDQATLGARYTTAHRALNRAYKQTIPFLGRVVLKVFGDTKSMRHRLALRVADTLTADEVNHLEAFVRGPLGKHLQTLNQAGTELIEDCSVSVQNAVQSVASRHFITVSFNQSRRMGW